LHKAHTSSLLKIGCSLKPSFISQDLSFLKFISHFSSPFLLSVAFSLSQNIHSRSFPPRTLLNCRKKYPRLTSLSLFTIQTFKISIALPLTDSKSRLIIASFIIKRRTNAFAYFCARLPKT